MFTRTEINTFHLSTAVAAYSEVVRAGEFLFLSGAGPVDESGAVVGKGIEEQTRFTMEMLTAISGRQAVRSQTWSSLAYSLPRWMTSQPSMPSTANSSRGPSQRAPLSQLANCGVGS